MNLLWSWNSRRMAAIAAACLVFATSAVMARSNEPLPARVQVTWAPTATLSEVKDNQMQNGWLRPEDWMRTLGDYLRTRADRLLPAGQQLQVTVDDIKLAGSFEPWHGPNLQDVRFMKDLYPPRLDLHYKLIASDGTTIRESGSKLLDMNYLQRAVPFANDPLRYDKRLIDDWLNREFRSSKR